MSKNSARPLLRHDTANEGRYANALRYTRILVEHGAREQEDFDNSIRES
jgi:hypothetical protein